MEEEMKEEGKQDEDKFEHVELDVASPGSSGGRPRRKAPSKDISQVPEVIDTVVEIAKSIKKRLPGTTGHTRHKAPSTIYQVPGLLRQEDGSCNIYEPQLISIGPYHRGKNGLQPMEEKKFQHVRKILSRNKKTKLEDYIKALTELETRAKKCYSQSFRKIKRDEFVEMMLLDGCFLVEIFLQNEDILQNEDFGPVIYDEMWLQDFISHDMLLLENQLPYFILECIFKLVVGDQKKVGSMAELALDCLHYIPVMQLNDAAYMKNRYHHLVDLFHHHCLPTPSEINNSGSGGGMDSSIKTKFVRPMKDFMTSFFSPEPKMHLEQQLPLQVPPDRVISSERKASTLKQGLKPKAAVIYFMTNIAGPVKAVIDRATSSFRSSHEETPSDKSDQQEPAWSIPSAEELEEAGIVFKPKKKKKNNISILRIEFHENGVIEIPYFNFSDRVNSVFQNFIAFELCRYPDADTFFMGYVIFMDCLINTDKDVKILRRSGVLDHGLGSDIELANVFNRMARGVFWDASYTRFAELFKGINEYGGRRCNRWRANLMHNYCNTPWAFLSFFAALVLLILTMTQTFFSIFPRN